MDFRLKLVVILLIVLGAPAGVGSWMARSAGGDVLVGLEEQVKSANEVVRLSDAVDDYGLIHAAAAAAAAPGVVAGMRCPPTEEGVRAQTREQTPAVDPVTGRPILDALGRPLDTSGEVIVQQSGPRCVTTQHNATLEALRGWNRAQEAARAENLLRPVYERAPGHAIPREPDLLIAATPDGTVVARVGRDMDNWFGPSRPSLSVFPTVGLAELGPQHGAIVWRDYDGATPQLAQIGVAPIVSDGSFLGTVTVGYFVINEAAEDDRQLNYGVDIAYFFRDQAGAAPTFAGTSYATRPAFLGAMQSAEYFLQRSDGSAETSAIDFATLTSSGIDKVYRAEIEGDTYFVIPTALSLDETGRAALSGYLVVASASDALAPLVAIGRTLPMVAVALFVLGLLGLMLTLRDLMRPIEEISKGIQEVIAGNREYMWPVDEKSFFSDLGHSLNIMSARLQGKRDPDAEDEGGGEEWAGLVGGGGQQQARAAGPGAVAGLGNIRGRRAQAESDDDAGSSES
jgi:hypothetical protein